MVELSMDTASEIAGVALTQDGDLVAEVTWRTRQNHSRELLPTVEWLLSRANLTRGDLAAVFVCIGPGSYAGLRVGLSTAKALAYALAIPVAGIGRLAADAALVRGATDHARIVAVQAAGRAELAWAVYSSSDGGLTELTPPRLSSRGAFVEALEPGDVVCGELDEDLRADLGSRKVAVSATTSGRVVAVAALGWKRLAAGSVDSTDALVPLYLREPAIGPRPNPIT
jgi:tRNA threonylcarbamoyladenosine biosynthesis protein TsaB